MRPAVSETPNRRTGALADELRLGAGFTAEERPWVLEALSALVPHLARWDPAEVGLEASVKHRDGKEQQVTLRADLPGYPPLVASAVDRDLDHALAEAKRELIRQVEDEKKKREPKSNRLLRKRTP
jgi:ribosome-associated translation inhibitor RaiA